MKGFKFKISINGFGESEEKAWENALHEMALFPPDIPTEENIVPICPDCGMEICMCDVFEEESI